MYFIIQQRGVPIKNFLWLFGIFNKTATEKEKGYAKRQIEEFILPSVFYIDDATYDIAITRLEKPLIVSFKSC